MHGGHAESLLDHRSALSTIVRLSAADISEPRDFARKPCAVIWVDRE
jgi:hypothetical protein